MLMPRIYTWRANAIPLKLTAMEHVRSTGKTVYRAASMTIFSGPDATYGRGLEVISSTLSDPILILGYGVGVEYRV